MDLTKEWEQKAIEYMLVHPGSTARDRVGDSDWTEAFKYAAEPETYPGSTVSKAGFTQDDVLVVIAAQDGENDGEGWLGAMILKDGRFAALRAWCDYTGWG